MHLSFVQLKTRQTGMSVLLLRFPALFLNFLVRGSGHQRYALSRRRSLAAAFLFATVFLLSHLALMLVKFKFIYLTLRSNLRSVEVSHLFSAHIVHVLPFLIRLLDTANFAFV